MSTESFGRLFELVSHQFGARVSLNLNDLEERAPELWRELNEVTERHIPSLDHLEAHRARLRSAQAQVDHEYWHTQDSQC
jgi:hypothetical protein